MTNMLCFHFSLFLGVFAYLNSNEMSYFSRQPEVFPTTLVDRQFFVSPTLLQLKQAVFPPGNPEQIFYLTGRAFFASV